MTCMLNLKALGGDLRSSEATFVHHALSAGLDTNCFQDFLQAFLIIFPIFPTNLPKFLKIFFSKISMVIK